MWDSNLHSWRCCQHIQIRDDRKRQKIMTMMLWSKLYRIWPNARSGKSYSLSIFIWKILFGLCPFDRSYCGSRSLIPQAFGHNSHAKRAIIKQTGRSVISSWQRGPVQADLRTLLICWQTILYMLMFLKRPNCTWCACKCQPAVWIMEIRFLFMEGSLHTHTALVGCAAVFGGCSWRWWRLGAFWEAISLPPQSMCADSRPGKVCTATHIKMPQTQLSLRPGETIAGC